MGNSVSRIHLHFLHLSKMATRHRISYFFLHLLLALLLDAVVESTPGRAYINPQITCPRPTQLREEVTIHTNFNYRIVNNDRRQPLRGTIIYSVCDIFNQCERGQKSFYVRANSRKIGYLTPVLRVRYDGGQGGRQVVVRAEGRVTGMTTTAGRHTC